MECDGWNSSSMRSLVIHAASLADVHHDEGSSFSIYPNLLLPASVVDSKLELWVSKQVSDRLIDWLTAHNKHFPVYAIIRSEILDLHKGQPLHAELLIHLHETMVKTPLLFTDNESIQNSQLLPHRYRKSNTYFWLILSVSTHYKHNILL